MLTRRLPSLILSLAALMGAFSACGGGGSGGGGGDGGGYGGGGGGGTPPANTIWVGNGGSMFTPDTLSVTQGTVITFVWKGSGHSLDQGAACTPAASPKFTSGGIQNVGYSMTWTPGAGDVGTVPFYCSSHCGMSMTGTLTVN